MGKPFEEDATAARIRREQGKSRAPASGLAQDLSGLLAA